MTNKQFHKNGQTINITKNYTVDYEPVEKNAFAKFIRDKRKEYNDEYGEELSTSDLGNIIGIKPEMFRKILNQEKPTKKRDCIIAICVALHLLPGEIDEALGLYQYMPALDTDNPRDGFIFAQITSDTHISVHELNNRLIQRGFPGLDVQNKRDGKTKIKETTAIDSPYKVMEMKVRTPVDTDYYYGDQYNSLCTTYDPFRCKSIGDMILGDPKRKKYIHLIADTEGYRSAQILHDEVLPHSYTSLEETGDYKNYFIELENAISLEKQRLLNILNDTKNYGVRTSARLIGDTITVFTEQFNYTVPELNEYYIVSFSSGHYKLYVYDSSAFMSWYLSEKTYKTHFGAERPVAKETYDSLEGLQNLINNTDKRKDSYIHYRMRQSAFKKLIPTVDSLYQKIKNRQEFIQNLGYIFENPADVLRYYEITKDFECKYDDEYGEICDCLKSKLYPLPDGTEIQITLDDIYNAFEFGFPDIHEICRIKSKYGSIEAVLN